MKKTDEKNRISTDWGHVDIVGFYLSHVSHGRSYLFEQKYKSNLTQTSIIPSILPSPDFPHVWSRLEDSWHQGVIPVKRA